MDKTALIGHTGFVGGHLKDQLKFDDFYNSKNIADIRKKEYDTIYCAGVSAVKYLANENPSKDLASITNLIDNLREVAAKKFVLISTIDVYKNLDGVDEGTKISLENHHAYGTHRRLLESFVNERFSNALIIRLPGLFGAGLKKNIIYDFLHNNEVEKIDSRHVFEFYDLKNLGHDIATALKNNLKLANFATEPVSVAEVARAAFNMDFHNTPAKSAIFYNMKTKHAALFGKDSKRGYIYNKDEVLSDICSFVAESKRELKGQK